MIELKRGNRFDQFWPRILVANRKKTRTGFPPLPSSLELGSPYESDAMATDQMAAAARMKGDLAVFNLSFGIVPFGEVQSGIFTLIGV